MQGYADGSRLAKLSSAFRKRSSARLIDIVTSKDIISKIINIEFLFLLPQQVMADRLTQLQDAIDELALQFVASLVWVNKHHDYQILSSSDIVRKDTKKDEAGVALPNEDGCVYSQHFSPADATHIFKVEPLPKDKFEEGQRELAQDLITKEQQIELLITALPGLENSENDQQQTIQRLERELKEEEERRKVALKEKEAILAKLEGVIRSVKRP